MNNAIVVLVLMILCHLLADYPLQGWLASAKKKSYWKDEPKCKHDYIAALICHSVMWGILIFVPIIYFSWSNLNYFWLLLPLNIGCHFVVDDLKANRNMLNLWQDQLIHLVQICLTWVAWFICMN